MQLLKNRSMGFYMVFVLILTMAPGNSTIDETRM
jgi:hypothetical protein